MGQGLTGDKGEICFLAGIVLTRSRIRILLFFVAFSRYAPAISCAEPRRRRISAPIGASFDNRYLSAAGLQGKIYVIGFMDGINAEIDLFSPV